MKLSINTKINQIYLYNIQYGKNSNRIKFVFYLIIKIILKIKKYIYILNYT